MVREMYQAVADASQQYEASGPGPVATPGAGMRASVLAAVVVSRTGGWYRYGWVGTIAGCQPPPTNRSTRCSSPRWLRLQARA